jgi:hypothetical protein
MKILVLKSIVGPRIRLRKGAILELKKKSAERYIKDGVARKLTKKEQQIEDIKNS